VVLPNSRHEIGNTLLLAGGSPEEVFPDLDEADVHTFSTTTLLS
jgi:hypothetical protein